MVLKLHLINSNIKLHLIWFSKGSQLVYVPHHDIVYSQRLPSSMTISLVALFCQTVQLSLVAGFVVL